MKEADNFKFYNRVSNKHVKVSGPNDILFWGYLPKHFTQIFRAQYGDAMLVPIRTGTNMATGNQGKHLTFTSAIKVNSLQNFMTSRENLQLQHAHFFLFD